MKLFEYQAKSILRSAGLNIPFGLVINHKNEIYKINDSIKSNDYVIKAQVLSGSRKSAGGVVIVKNYLDAAKSIEELLGSKLYTIQSDGQGETVESVLVEEFIKYKSAYYLSICVDRVTQLLTLMFSHYDNDIEQFAVSSPESIIKLPINIKNGLTEIQLNEISRIIKLDSNTTDSLINKLIDLYIEYDMSLLEINPLVIDDKLSFYCLDAKIQIDDSALYRQNDIRKLRDNRLQAFNYLKLDGCVGCISNGAGLAMATNDLLIDYGISPSNFLDLSGNSNSEDTTEAIKKVLLDDNTRVVFVNIFGGIVSCKDVANALIKVHVDIDNKKPIITRFDGNESELADILLSSNAGFIVTTNLSESIERIKEQL